MSNVKELTVREISKELGYEVKVVKESEKPYQFKAGDVVESYSDFRIIIEMDGKLAGFDIYGKKRCSFGTVQDCSYKKIGELKDYIK